MSLSCARSGSCLVLFYPFHLKAISSPISRRTRPRRRTLSIPLYIDTPPPLYPDYLVWSHDEPDYPDGVMNYTRPSDVEIREAAAQLLKDYDRDRSQMLSLEEWTQGGGF